MCSSAKDAELILSHRAWLTPRRPLSSRIPTFNRLRVGPYQVHTLALRTDSGFRLRGQVLSGSGISSACRLG